MSMSSHAPQFRIAFLVGLASILTACGEEPPPPSEVVRAVRTITVNEPASGRVRRFSGVVEAADSSSIGFEVSGVVEEIKVDVGDRVAKGQQLAILDKGTYQLNVEATKAGVQRVEVEYGDAQTDWERLQRIAQEDIGATSQRALDQALATRDSARQNLRYATARLNLAKRDLERTVLYSPFDGVIAKRHVDAFEQVNRGQQVFDLFMEDAMEAAIRIPESEIKQIYLGLPGEVRFPALPDRLSSGIVTEISEVAGAGNAFPVRVAIDADNAAIRPGSTAEVTLMLGGETSQGAYLIPLEALVPGSGGEGSYVFKFDAETSTVSQTPVEYSGIRDSEVAIAGGLNAGDIIVVAGVSFLRDGQQVRLMQ